MNASGLFDMAGNVWEWTDDWFAARNAVADLDSPCCASHQSRANSHAGAAETPGSIPCKVVKGGSFLCALTYCRRYRPPNATPSRSIRA